MSVINQVLKDLDSRDKMTDEKSVEHFAVEKNPETIDADWLRTGVWSLLVVILLSAGAYYYVLNEQAKATVFYEPVTASLKVNKPETQPVEAPVVEAQVVESQAVAPQPVEPQVVVQPPDIEKPTEIKPVDVEPVETKLAPEVTKSIQEDQAETTVAASSTIAPPKVAYLPLKDDGKEPEPYKPEPKSDPAEFKIVKAQKKPIDKAREMITSGRLIEAEAALKEIVSGKQYSSRAYELLTAVQLRSNRMTDANQTLSKALKVYPYNTNLNLMQARIFVSEGKTAAAVNLLEKQLQTGKPSIKTMAMLAPLYQNQRKYESATGLYRQLVNRQPSQGQNWMGLATNLDALGDHANALKAYQRALQLGLNSSALQKYANDRMRKLAQQADANSGT